MLWVVIGHSFLGSFEQGPVWENVLCKFAYSFHMPLFMLVSGWLFYRTRLSANMSIGGGKLNSSRWNYWQIVKDKAIRLLLPGLLFSIISYGLKWVFPSEISRQVGLKVNDIIYMFLYPYDNPFREFWFIATLFWLFLLTPLWKFVLRQVWMKWSMLVVLVVVHFWHPSLELLCIGRVFSYSVWFYLGLLVSEVDFVDRFLSKQMWWTLLAGVAIYAMGWVLHPFVTTIGGITLSFGLALIADRFIPKLFYGFRNYTYQIFLMGILAQMFVKIMNRHVSMPYIGAYLFCLMAGLYVPVLVSKVIEKIDWKPLSLCVGLK